MESNQPRLHLWCPDILGSRGGIQVFSAHFLEAVKSICPHLTCDVILEHDSERNAPATSPPHTNFYFSGDWRPGLRKWAHAEKLIRLGLKQRPKLVITTHLHFSIAAYMLKRIAGIPFWAVAHGVEAWNIKRRSLQLALRNADRILAVSSYTRDRLLAEQDIAPERISILPNTVNPDLFQICGKPEYLLKRYGLKASQPVILTVSRLVTSEQYKGYDKILRALPRIREVLPNVHYILAGHGNDRARIERLIASLNLTDHVSLAGYVPDEELCDHYNLCDIFAMPSKREGFGIVYLEALACGKPTLAGNKDGAADALRGGELGVLVDPDDVEAIAQGLINILQGVYPHPLLYHPEALRQRVIDIYGFARFKETLASNLSEFFNGANPTAHSAAMR